MVNRIGNAGLIADFFTSSDCSGEAFYSEEYPRTFISTLMNTNVDNAGSMRVTAVYTPSQSGKHYLSFSGIGPSKLYINGGLVSHQQDDTADSMGFFLGVQEEHRFQYGFVAGEKYNITIDTTKSLAQNAELYLLNNLLSIHLGLVPQKEMEADLEEEALALAREADVAICFVGNTVQWETEGQDLASMTLPADGSQDRLVSAIAGVQPNTVVVVTTGVPVELPWLDKVGAVLQAWYAGQETGNAIMDAIIGESNPSGKLPMSWPKKYEHTSCYGNFGLDSYESREVEYVEGVYVGYRDFDRHYGTEKEVLFPFGYGLSYSDFEISAATVSGGLESSGDRVIVTASVKNTSARAGAEAVQVYLAPPAGSIDRPVKSLVGFDKIFLQPGETSQVSITFARDAAAFWDEANDCWRVEAGKHEILVATSSRPSDVKAKLLVDIQSAATFDP